MSLFHRALLAVAVVVALGSAVTTTYVASETSRVAAAIASSTTDPTQPAIGDTTAPPPQDQPSCPPGQHFISGPGSACVCDQNNTACLQQQYGQQPQDQGPQPGQPMPPYDGSGQQWQGNNPPPPGQGGPQFGGPGDQGGYGQGNFPPGCGPDGCPGDQGPRNGPSLRDWKNKLKQMKRDYNQLETLVKREVAKDPASWPQELKENMSKAKAIVDAVESATSDDDLANIEPDEFWNLRGEADRLRNEIREENRQLKDLQRNVMKGVEQGLRMFKQQIAKLTKQKIGVPAEITEAITKIETLLTTIKSAKTWAEVEDAGVEDIGEVFMNFDQYRMQLEQLARWPQALRQANQEVKRLESELKRAKTIVNRLAKTVDLTDTYQQFADAIATVKSARDQATSSAQSGNIEEAFDTLENGVFMAMEETWQYSNTIQTMSNLGKFATDSKRGITDAQRIVNELKRRRDPETGEKYDTSELEDIIRQAQEKRDEILAIMKVKGFDLDEVLSLIQEMEEIRSKFEEATGEEKKMPWEGGPQQFQQIQGFDQLQKMVPMGGGPGPGGPGGGPMMGPPGMGPGMGPGGPGF